jgi:hypothetical protein
MITVKIDVTKIDKNLLFKGAKGTYLDVVLFETPDDKFGNDYRVVQGVTKEARAAGVKGAILGNGKVIGGNAKPAFNKAEPKAVASEDVPF